MHDHSATLSSARQTYKPRHASLAATHLGLAMSAQAPQPPVQRSQTGAGGDLPGGPAMDFTFDWVHAYGVMRIEVKAGQIYVDGRVVQVVCEVNGGRFVRNL